MDARARIGLAVAGVALYALASFELTTRAADAVPTLAVVLGPLVLSVLGSIWASGRRGVAVALGVVALVAVAASARGRGVPAPWLYLAQHAGMHAALGVWFAGSLRGEPLVTRMAARLHALTPAMRRYTRHCTIAWAVYFAAMTAMSLLLFALAPFAVWSLFANLLTPLALVAMFAGEHLLRYRLHPEFERVGLLAAARAFSGTRAMP